MGIFNYMWYFEVLGNDLERVGNSVNRLRAVNFILHFTKIFSHSTAMTKNLWLVQNEISSLSLDHENPNTLLDQLRPLFVEWVNGFDRTDYH